MARRKAPATPPEPKPRKPRARRPKVLTEMQKVFIRCYLLHRNASKAARQAGYSPHSAADTGHRLLKDPEYAHVQAALQLELEKDEKEFRSLRDLALQHIRNVLSLNKADLYDQAGELKPIHEIDPHDLAALQELKRTDFKSEDGQDSQVWKVREYSRNEAAALAAKIAGLTKDKIEHGGTLDIRTARTDLDLKLAGMVPRESLTGGAGGEEPGSEGEAPPGADG